MKATEWDVIDDLFDYLQSKRDDIIGEGKDGHLIKVMTSRPVKLKPPVMALEFGESLDNDRLRTRTITTFLSYYEADIERASADNDHGNDRNELAFKRVRTALNMLRSPTFKRPYKIAETSLVRSDGKKGGPIISGRIIIQHAI